MTTYGSGTQPEVQYVRRTGLGGKDETASSIAVHDLTGAIYVTGTYLASADSKYQGSDIGEDRFLAASASSDGGDAYEAARSSGLSLNSGDDVFGLSAAGRATSVGCPRQRTAPLDQHEERLGLTGLPDCTMYSHAAATGTPTGFVVKFNDNGDETTRGNKNRKKYPSITGHATADSSIADCDTRGKTAETDGEQHVLTQAADCKTHPSGCSCLSLEVTSVTAGTTDAGTGVGLAHTWNGMKIKIVSGAGAGYEGIISAFHAANKEWNTIPAIPVALDETSKFVLNPWSELGPRIHKAACSDPLDLGCQAYAVEWAKTIGWPIGQTKTTQTAYGSTSDVNTEDSGEWTQSPGTNTATVLYLAPKHAVETTTFYDNYLVELAGAATYPYAPITVATITAYAASDDAANGGKLTIACPDTSGAACPVLAANSYYRLKKVVNTATKVNAGESKGTLAQSSPQVVTMVDSDVYVAGWFKGFNRFRFGIEGVDEVVGYKSVGYDTWESYMVKLQD